MRLVIKAVLFAGAFTAISIASYRDAGITRPEWWCLTALMGVFFSIPFYREFNGHQDDWYGWSALLGAAIGVVELAVGAAHTLGKFI